MNACVISIGGAGTLTATSSTTLQLEIGSGSHGATIDLPDGYQVQLSYFDDASTSTFETAGGNDVSLLVTIPEPTSAATLLAGFATLLGLQRFRRRD